MLFRSATLYQRGSRCYTIFDGVLYRQGIDGVLQQAIDAKEASKVVKQYHDGFYEGHYAANYTAKKILHAGYYWPVLFKDVIANLVQGCHIAL